MKLLIILMSVQHLVLSASIADVSCPESCTCPFKEDYFEATCNSYEFIKKLIPKQVSTIVRLNINNAQLVNIDSKLKYLKNLNTLDLSNNAIASVPSQFPYLPKLKTLNLSNNHLKSVTLSALPKNLQVLDLSRNSISNFPEDWSSLKQLKTLHFHDNPIDCDCNNLLKYSELKLGGVTIPDNLTCHYPKEFYGRSLSSVNCSMITENLLNSMLGDEAGSGEPDIENNFEETVPVVDEEFLEAHDNSNATKEQQVDESLEMEENNTTEYVEPEEGSGEGSGDESLIPILPIPSPKACYINCSTPKPVGSEDEHNASPPPNIVEQGKIIFDDIFNHDATSTATTPATSATTTETPNLKEVEEPSIVKESDKSDVETFPSNDTVIGEMERASIQSSNSQTTYIVVGLLITLAVFTIIYFVNKKRNSRRNTYRKRNKSNENGFGEELKPLGKSAEKPIQVKPIEKANSKPQTVEQTPLLNGQNGKITDDKIAKPHQPTENKEFEDIDLRQPSKQELLTPQLERVTIKAGEIPDSIPKTPMLVHRQINSDGEVITTEISN